MKRIIIILILLSSCNQSKKTPEKFDESDYYRTQGIIKKVEMKFNYTDKFTPVYYYDFLLINNQIKPGVEKDSDLIFRKGDAVVIMVNLKDSSDYFIATRGRISKENLNRLLKSEDSNLKE